MSLPVITLQGNSFPSRVASSLLINLNLPELIHQSIESYESQAIELALNPAKHNDLKKKLAANRLQEALFDTQLFMKRLEYALSAVYQRHANGLSPEDLF
jgi:predicted O-linked N-acetylglucosamine transferase (SPINDLY family)